MQGTMHPCGSLRAVKTGSIVEVQMGGYCVRFACPDKEGRNESKKSWLVSSGFHLRAEVLQTDNLHLSTHGAAVCTNIRSCTQQCMSIFKVPIILVRLHITLNIHFHYHHYELCCPIMRFHNQSPLHAHSRQVLTVFIISVVAVVGFVIIIVVFFGGSPPS